MSPAAPHASGSPDNNPLRAKSGPRSRGIPPAPPSASRPASRTPPSLLLFSRVRLPVPETLEGNCTPARTASPLSSSPTSPTSRSGYPHGKFCARHLSHSLLLIDHSRRRGHPIRCASSRFHHQMPHHIFQVSRLLEDAQLPVRARPLIHDRVHVLHRAPASQIIQHVIHKLEQFRDQLPHRHFRFLPEIDQLPFNSITRRAPVVLFDQRPPVQPPAHIPGVEPVDLHHNRLCQRRNRHGFFHFRGHESGRSRGDCGVDTG